RLVPESGVARLDAWISRDPEDANDPYVCLPLATLYSRDGRPRKVVDAIARAMPKARADGPPSHVAWMLEATCDAQLDRGPADDARSELRELDALADKDPSLRANALDCAVRLTQETGQLQAALAQSEQLAKLDPTDGWYPSM